jgi:hypothetical protein
MKPIPEVERLQLLDVLLMAQQRLDALKGVVITAKDESQVDQILRSIRSAMTPLSIAFQATQAL